MIGPRPAGYNVTTMAQVARVGTIDVPMDRLEAFCRKWDIAELAVFGSVLRHDFDPDSDVDVLVSLRPRATMTFEGFLDMRDEFRDLFGRDVDMIEKRLITNPFRRHEILTTKKVLYAA